jgi:hypothetical protein
MFDSTRDSQAAVDELPFVPPAHPAPAVAAPASHDSASGNGHAGDISHGKNGKRNKGGAKKGNRNNYRHGLKSRHGPETDHQTAKIVDPFRRATEDAVVAIHGKITPHCALLIYAAMQSLRFSVDEQRDIDTHGSKWTPEQRTAKRESVVKRLAEVNRCMRDVGLTAVADADASDQFTAGIAARDATTPPAASPAASAMPKTTTDTLRVVAAPQQAP